MADRAAARAAKEHLAGRLSGASGVVGIGLEPTPSGYGIKVNVRDAADGDQVPEAVHGVPVRVAVVGSVRPQG